MADLIPITPHIAISSHELEESFIRSSGPGGQNVNKVSTAVQLRFDLKGSPSLPDALKLRAGTLAGSKLTKDGVIIITANEHRVQQMNRDAARERLVALLKEAAIVPKRRRPTRPTLASKERRLAGKTQRSGIKQMRRAGPSED